MLALFSKLCASRLALACALALAFSSLPAFCPLPGGGARINMALNTAVVKIAIRQDFFTGNLPTFNESTILRTRRHHFPIRHCHDPEKSAVRAVSGTACFGCNCFAEICFDIALIDI